MSVWAIILAGGSGERFGGDKMFRPIGGWSVIERAVFPAAGACDGVVVVTREPHSDFDWLDRLPIRVEQRRVPGGDTRSDSVRAGLTAVPDDAKVIVVHDAARPLASRALWEAVIEAVVTGSEPCAVPVLPISDSIRHADVGTPAYREDFVIVQTPQAFDAEALRAAHSRPVNCSDDAGLFNEARFVPGEPTNIKITYPHDVDVARGIERTL